MNSGKKSKPMRTAEDFRLRLLDSLQVGLTRPTFFGGSGDFGLWGLLSDLCWLEEREADFDKVCGQLLHGCMRVYGQFYFQHKSIPDGFANEIASTYAEAAYRLGFLQSATLLSPESFAQLSAALDTEFFAVDHREAELIEQFGEPSWSVLGDTTVLCYGCTDPTRNWVYFDVSHRSPQSGDGGWFKEPILRDIRRDENRFEFLPFGAWCDKTPEGTEEE